MAAFPLTKSGFSRLLGAAVTLTCMALPLVPSSPVSAAVQGPLKVDFGPAGTVVPAGYVLDIGGMYTASRAGLDPADHVDPGLDHRQHP